jgi:hypothetical protein
VIKRVEGIAEKEKQDKSLVFSDHDDNEFVTGDFDPNGDADDTSIGANDGEHADGTTIGDEDGEHIQDATTGVYKRDNGENNDNGDSGDDDAENESPGILLDNDPAMNTEAEADEIAGVLGEDALTDDITVITDAIVGDPETPRVGAKIT